MEVTTMGMGTSIFLFAVGAILRFAVDVQTKGFDLHTIGVILMGVGAVGALASMVFWSSWGGFGNTRTTTVQRDGVSPEQRTVVVEKETRL